MRKKKNCDHKTQGHTNVGNDGVLNALSDYDAQSNEIGFSDLMVLKR